MTLRGILIGALVSAFASFSGAGELSQASPTLCKPNIPYGAPTPSREALIRVCRTAYALDFDTTAKIPSWVSYVLKNENAFGCYPRVSSFRIEPSVPVGTSASQKDYAKSGYDIGHMANSADLRWSRQTEIDSEVFSNAAPQTPELNRGEWKTLEDQIRQWAITRNNDLLIYVGPIYNRSAPTYMKSTAVIVPTSFYKMIVDTKTKEVLSFVYPNVKNVQGSLVSFMTSFQEVQRLTGIVFPLPKTAVFSNTLWSTQERTSKGQKIKACTVK